MSSCCCFHAKKKSWLFRPLGNAFLIGIKRSIDIFPRCHLVSGHAVLNATMRLEQKSPNSRLCECIFPFGTFSPLSLSLFLCYFPFSHGEFAHVTADHDPTRIDPWVAREWDREKPTWKWERFELEKQYGAKRYIAFCVRFCHAFFVSLCMSANDTFFFLSQNRLAIISVHATVIPCSFFVNAS